MWIYLTPKVNKQLYLFNGADDMNEQIKMNLIFEEDYFSDLQGQFENTFFDSQNIKERLFVMSPVIFLI